MRPPRFFPPHQPRDAKIKPNHLRTIHKEDSWDSNISAGLSLNICDELLQRWSTICWWVGSLIASPVSRMSAGQVRSGRRVNLGLGNCSPPVQVGSMPICWSSALCASPDLVVGNRSPACFQLAGTIWGLWMVGFAKNLTNLWGCPCQISAHQRVIRQLRVFSSWGAYGTGLFSAVHCWWGSAPDRTLGNSVGAIESVARSVGVLCTFAAKDWSLASAGYLPSTFRPFWGCTRALRRLGRGLLPGWFCQ